MAVHDGDTIPPFLPDEIMINIFKRLPVKSLIRFQCVCNHWKNLVKSPYLITDHLHHPTNQGGKSFLFQQRGAHPSNLFVADCEMQGIDNVRKAHVMGTCNGLICVLSNFYTTLCRYLFLWNPATREVRQVPGVIRLTHERKYLHKGKKGAYYYGFGYSPVLNDYKIVKIFRSYECMFVGVEVYSLKTDSWREIEFGDIIKGARQFIPYASDKGSIFWYVASSSIKNYGMLLSFDATMDVFTDIPELGYSYSCYFKVIVHDKKLVLLHLNSMMEEDVDASGAKKLVWTELDRSSPYFGCYFQRYHPFIETRVCHGVQISHYVESLVSIVNY